MNGGEPRIVAFTKDWDDVPTCTTHVLREMGRTMPVLWVNSIGTRKPRLAHPSHAGRLARRLGRALRRAELKENRLRVLSPLLMPKAESRFWRAANRVLFAWQAGRELRDMGSGRVEYWCFVPNAVDLLPAEAGRAGAEAERPLVIYYCVDDWSRFTYLDSDWVAAKERAMLARADIVFSPARYLVGKMKALSGGRVPVHYIPHGVEYAKFRAALDAGGGVPPDLEALGRPVVGFYGNIYPWVDLALVEKVARALPATQFAMIGGVFCDVSAVAALPNVHFLGRREHDALPAYCRGFDAAMIPYDLSDPRMESVNPVKARELLAAGVPIVASDVPELRGFGDRIEICATAEEWVAAIGRQVRRPDRARISASVAGDDWARRVQELRKWTTDVGT